MEEHITDDISVGKYRGLIAEQYNVPEFSEAFGRISDIISASDSKIISAGRNLNVIVTISGRELVVKSFGCQSFLKDRADTVVGGKARRTWQAADVLCREKVGTPVPVAFLEYIQGGRFLESYYISELQAEVTSFGDELIHLYRREPECARMMELLEAVAEGVSRMHGAGVQHNDLGNQNILLRRLSCSEWGDVSFIDLNRACIGGKLSDRQRARDISRLNLPSELLRVFKDMYYGGAIPPESFHKWERFYRSRYAVHCATRNLRHPIRWLRKKPENTGQATASYPMPRDMWIWDERSGQPINTLGSKDRNALYSKGQFWRIAFATIAGLGRGVWSEYKKLLSDCWKKPVALKDRIGMAIEPDAENIEREIDYLNKLGGLPVIIRFYHHKGKEQWDLAADVVKRLAVGERKITAALVQDRESSKNIELWDEFVRYVIGKTDGMVEHYELGHAINRVKWGIWDLREYRRMMDVAVRILKEHPNVKFTGPAVIDFEYPFLLAVLRMVPKELKFAALSHHLYVDRRGAPENRQGPFSALEKFVLAKAIGRCTDSCGDELIVSEVNWPLNGTGVYSPVCSPYESPQERATDPTVSEDDYCDYMLRYILMAVCSGMVERVYWWRLVARGYGLVDDTDSANWKERPGYKALEYFIRTLGNATFNCRNRKLEVGNPGLSVYEFVTDTGKAVSVLYSVDEKMEFTIPFEFDTVTDAFGQKIEAAEGAVVVTGRCVYVDSGEIRAASGPAELGPC